MNEQIMVDKSFSQIRRDMAPEGSYCILEYESAAHDLELARTIMEELPLQPGDVIEKRFYRDPVSRRILLVIRLVPHRDDEVRDRIMSHGFAEEITIHYYKRHMDSGRNELEAC